jgi:hypothetical protein
MTQRLDNIHTHDGMDSGVGWLLDQLLYGRIRNF